MNTVLLNNQRITPSKVVCIGRNYVEHIKELGNDIPDDMVVFIKPNSAISESLVAFHQEPLHYEAELCFMVLEGKFAAVAIGLDLTKRQLQSQLKSKGLPWERAKAFNGSAVFSEFVAIDSIDESLSLQLTIDGELKQQGNISLMMYKPDEILAQLSTFLTLDDGDVVMTGTPKGVGEIKPGQWFNGQVFLAQQLLIEQRWLAAG